MGSTSGRARALTDDQIKTILAHHAQYLTWRALRATFKSQRQLAREFGVSQGTIHRAVRLQGQYKRGPRRQGL